MGKNKLAQFADMEKFHNVLQPKIEDITNNAHPLQNSWKEHFGNSNPIVLELGCGKGEYVVGLARQNPNINYIGVDIKGARMWRGAKTAIEEGLPNVAFLRTRIDFIERFFGVNEVHGIWLTFSDPQILKPKKRLTSSLFINRYRSFLTADAIINVKTDSRLLYNFTHEQIDEHGYRKLEFGHDVYNHPENISEATQEALSIKTHYESIWLRKGFNINYISFQL